MSSFGQATHKPALPSRLQLLESGLVVSAHESFDVGEFFLRNKKLKTYDHRGRNFTRLVTGRVEKVPAGTMTKYRTTRYITGTDLVAEIGEGHNTYFADIAAKIDTLEKDGRWHIFPMTMDGMRWLVYFVWLVDIDRQGWDFCASQPGGYDFDEDGRVFSRDSVTPKP